MAGNCIDKIPHSCGSSDGLQVFENDGEITGYCFACGTFVPKPYGDADPPDLSSLKVKTTEQRRAAVKQIQDEMPILADDERKLSERSMKYFGVRSSLSEYDGSTLTAKYYPYYDGDNLTGFKVKTKDKQFYAVGTTSNTDPFGWHKVHGANTSKLFITEGEDDAVALLDCLMSDPRKKFQGTAAVISVGAGASSTRSLGRRQKEILQRFKDIIVVFDQDEAGQAGARKISNLFPNCKVANFELKDANDMVKAGRSKELFTAVMYEAQSLPSGKCIRSSDAWAAAEEKVEWGLPWPWPSMTEMTRGRRRGEVYYFGAGVKMGKSVLVDQLAAHCITTQDSPVMLVKPEEPIPATLKRLAGKAAKAVFWDPKVPFDDAAWQRGKKAIGSGAIIYDSYQEVRWADVKQEIRHNVENCGVKDVFLDPLTCFTVGISLTEANEELIRIASEVAALAKQLDFTAYLFCHLNAPSSGVPHERGGAVLSQQFSGSRAMMRFCHAMWGLEGNKDPDLPVEVRNTRSLVLLEDRNFGETGRVDLKYDSTTGMLDEFTKEDDYE